jgi:tRNA(fMet)-specific endonuclease VapC
MYMLDTNICVYAINRKPALYLRTLEQLDKKHNIIVISSIVLAELQFGVANSIHKEQNQINLNKFLSAIVVVDFTARAALFYGELKAELRKSGKMTGDNDMLIASHAISEEAVLVTNNISEFSRIKNLVVENWGLE